MKEEVRPVIELMKAQGRAIIFYVRRLTDDKDI